MKKVVKQKKLQVKTETVRQLANGELADAQGGQYIVGVTYVAGRCTVSIPTGNCLE